MRKVYFNGQVLKLGEARNPKEALGIGLLVTRDMVRIFCPRKTREPNSTQAEDSSGPRLAAIPRGRGGEDVQHLRQAPGTTKRRCEVRRRGLPNRRSSPSEVPEGPCKTKQKSPVKQIGVYGWNQVVEQGGDGLVRACQSSDADSQSFSRLGQNLSLARRFRQPMTLIKRCELVELVHFGSAASRYVGLCVLDAVVA